MEKPGIASWGIQTVVTELQKLGLDLDKVIVSNFDSDTVTHHEYFARVSYEFITAKNPLRASYQPIPLYDDDMSAFAGVGSSGCRQ